MSGYKDENPDDLPADDFATEDQYDDVAEESYDDAEVGDDDSWDDQSDDGGDGSEQSDKPQKKKSGFIFYVIIAVVVLAGLGFVATQLMGGGADPAAVPADAAATEPPPADPAAVPATDVAAVPEAATAPVPAPAPEEHKGFLNGDPVPEETPAVQPAEPAPGLPEAPALTAVESTGTTPPAEELPAPATPAVPEDPAVIGGLKPVSDFPSVDQIKKLPTETAEPGPTLEAAAPAEPAPVAAVEPAPLPVPTGAAAPAEPAPAAVPQVNAAEVAVLQGKLDAALAKIDTLEKAAKEAKAAPAPAADTGKVTELEAKVAELQQKLDDKSSALAKAEDEVRSIKEADRVSAPPVTSRASEEPAERPAVKPRVVRPAPVTPSTARVSWELRGAQPGKAMLSRKGADDVRSVAVGDTVPGLGTIRSIDQTSAGWTVRGTLGQVTQ